MRPERTDFIRQAWLVILLGIFYGGALAGVQIGLSGRIAENRRNETYDVIPQLAPGADKESTVELVTTGPGGRAQIIYQAFSEAGEHVGWVVPAGGRGFVEQIDLLIGLDAPRQTITGIYVLEQKETPGLGDYITAGYFRDRFAGKPADQPLTVVKRAPTEVNEIESLTGATVSSETVANIVNATVAMMKDFDPTAAMPADAPAAQPQGEGSDRND